MKILGLIPARKGSKGVPNKNTKNIAGAPLVTHTVSVALESEVFHRVVVSTDCEATREIVESAGATAPFLRDPALAGDSALATAVIADALEKSERFFSESYDVVCMLQPTTPLRSVDDCRNVAEILRTQQITDSVISVVEASQNPYKLLRRDGSGKLQPFLDWPVENPPRQSLPKFYAYNGAFYATRTEVFKETHSFKGTNCTLYEMPLERSVNIDSLFDFEIAELLLNKRSM